MHLDRLPRRQLLAAPLLGLATLPTGCAGAAMIGMELKSMVLSALRQIGSDLVVRLFKGAVRQAVGPVETEQLNAYADRIGVPRGIVLAMAEAAGVETVLRAPRDGDAAQSQATQVWFSRSAPGLAPNAIDFHIRNTTRAPISWQVHTRIADHDGKGQPLDTMWNAITIQPGQQDQFRHRIGLHASVHLPPGLKRVSLVDPPRGFEVSPPRLVMVMPATLDRTTT